MNRLIVSILASISVTTNILAQEALVPNPKLTPGKIAERDQDRQGVTLAMEQRVFARYRIPWSRRGEFKIDHLIPLELGGADSIENLWPQSRRAKPYGADRKKLLTQVLLARTAAGQITLAQAQEQISKDWIDAFIDQLGMVYLR